MCNNKIKKKILNLKKKINKYTYYYLNKNKNLIKDEKYDILLKKLEKLEKKFTQYQLTTSPTKQIKYFFKKTLEINKHSLPMLSIKNSYSKNQINKFIKKIQSKYYKTKFCCELKIDGIAISLIYKNNNLYKSLTRGNGSYGENITKNINYIKSIPKFIKTDKKIKKLEIRGELYINKKNFLKINKKKKFSNSRNLVSGTIRQTNNKIIKKRKLSFIAYDIIINNIRYIYKTQYESLKQIKKLGFSIEKKTKTLTSFNKIISFYKKINKIRKKIKFDIDGIIIKINNKKIQENLGNSNKFNKWSIALKFPTKKKITQIKKIKLKVGKNGIITPIGIIKSIKLGGTKIKKINLYNLNYLLKLSLNINNKIIIQRSGDVIPSIYKVIKEKKKKKIIIPEKCPSCKKKINIYENVPKCYFNFSCPTQLKNTIINFISKNGFNIKGIGKKTIKKLIKNKKIKNAIDILSLSKKDFSFIKRIKEKLSNKIIQSITFSVKNIKLKNLIYSLSIPNIGINTSKYLSEKINKFKKFIYIKKNELKKYNNNLNNKKIKSILKYTNNKKNIKNLLLLNKIIKKSKNKNI